MVKIESIRRKKEKEINKTKYNNRSLNRNKSYFNSEFNSKNQKNQGLSRDEFTNFLKINKCFKETILKYSSIFKENEIYEDDFLKMNYKEILNVKDDKNNSPLHLACINDQINFLKSLKLLDFVMENFEFFIKEKNKENLTPLCYVRNRNFMKEILQTDIQKSFFQNISQNKKLKNFKFKSSSTNKNYHIPSVALEINIDTEKRQKILNSIINICRSKNLDLTLMEHCNKDKCFLLIDISEQNFRIEAENQKLKFKMLNKNLKKAFCNKDDYINEVEPAYTRHYNIVITNIIKKILDLKLLVNQENITKIFYLHRPGICKKIKKSYFQGEGSSWYQISPFTFFIKNIFEGAKYNYTEVNTIYRYLGEKAALYFAFISFLGNNLLVISIGSFILLIYKNKEILNFSYSPSYGIVYSFWFIYFVIKWKRKSTEITHQWGLNNNTTEKIIRDEFIGDEYSKNNDLHLQKHADNYNTLLIFTGFLPVNLILIVFVILVFIFTNKYGSEYKNVDYLRFLPSIINSVSISVVGVLYEYATLYLTNLENHKYQDRYEAIIIIKLFAFKFIINFLAVIFNIFIYGNFENLHVLLYTLIMSKIASHIIVRYLKPFVMFKINKFIYFYKIRQSIKKAKNFLMIIRDEIRGFLRKKKNKSDQINLKLNEYKDIFNKNESKKVGINSNNNNNEIDNNKFINLFNKEKIFLNNDLIRENKFLKILPRYYEKVNIINKLSTEPDVYINHEININDNKFNYNDFNDDFYDNNYNSKKEKDDKGI
jgi:hypothetical protein